jgi:hypothetical protein
MQCGHEKVSESTNAGNVLKSCTSEEKNGDASTDNNLAVGNQKDRTLTEVRMRQSSLANSKKRNFPDRLEFRDRSGSRS